MKEQSTVISSNNNNNNNKSFNIWGHVRRRLPIFGWISNYTVQDGISDAIAGLTVGLTVVPQSLAYAAIAGLSPKYGLQSSYLACFVYVLLGSCRQATIGPTAVMGLLAFQTCGVNNPSCAILTAFYTGIIELLMAFLRLGWVVNFISEPVTVGFTSGAATTIFSSQAKNLLGIQGNKGSGFLGYWSAFFRDFQTIHIPDAVLGISSFIALLLLRKVKDIWTTGPKLVKSTLWFISLSKNVITIIFTACLSYFIATSPFEPFHLVGKVIGGFPKIQPPEFHLPCNSTEELEDLTCSNDSYGFFESMGELGSGPFVIAIIGVLQNVAISKTFGQGQKVDATQEMIALGVSNILGSFFQCIPVSASFSRSAVNEASGVRTPISPFYTGVVVLLALGFLTPTFYFIPKASLAAVIMCAVVFMVDFGAMKLMWKLCKLDFAICISSYLASIFLGMEYGILIGVLFSCGAHLYRSRFPKMEEQKLKKSDATHIEIKPQLDGLSFFSAPHVVTFVTDIIETQPSCTHITVDCEQLDSCDYTVVISLVALYKAMSKVSKVVDFINCDRKLTSALEDSAVPIQQIRTKGVARKSLNNEITASKDYTVVGTTNDSFSPDIECSKL